MTDATKCRKNGWNVGTWLRGKEGSKAGGWYRITTIEITAIGESHILAKTVGEVSFGCAKCRELPGDEELWTLSVRKWKKVA